MINRRINQKGFSAVEAIIILIVLVILAGAGYVVYRHQHKNKDTSASKTTTSSSQSKKDNNGDTATNNQSNVFKIPELGIQFTLPQGQLADLKYVVSDVNYHEEGTNNLGTYPTAYMGTKQLDDLGCPATGVLGNAPALGFVTKTTGQYPTKPDSDNATGKLVKQFSDFYISYRSRGFGCFDDDAKNKLVTDGGLQLQEALKTIELIK